MNICKDTDVFSRKNFDNSGGVGIDFAHINFSQDPSQIPDLKIDHSLVVTSSSYDSLIFNPTNFTGGWVDAGAAGIIIKQENSSTFDEDTGVYSYAVTHHFNKPYTIESGDGFTMYVNGPSINGDNNFLDSMKVQYDCFEII